jgi:aminopeptidase
MKFLEHRKSFYKFASDEQLDYVSPVTKMIVETFDAYIHLWADVNTRGLSGIDPNRVARSRKAGSAINQKFLQRAAEGSFRWSLTVYPNNAMAQEARHVAARLCRLRIWRGHAR